MKEKELHSWSSVTSNICENYAEKFNLLLLQKCTVCDSSFEEGLVWCEDCGPLATYCQGCTDVSHKNIAFHNAITLKPNFDMMTCTFHNTLHDAHCYSCSNKYFRVITIVSEKGNI
ncbi:uncharacterized protein LOC130649215 [Hydractinia symbiolongicarpus]|uniref:uncharacterized protein LOC130649215 n=1 Tax=Hydractinia symbiolongicarpus TaxID=13093 RepID=UPI00254DB22E|nr:uncharacterized protein LOC130649215 [Hydractinia symbiolongicarpus]